MRARAVAAPVCSQAQMVRAKLVMEVPRMEVNWPSQTRVKPRIPARRPGLIGGPGSVPMLFLASVGSSVISLDRDGGAPGAFKGNSPLVLTCCELWGGGAKPFLPVGISCCLRGRRGVMVAYGTVDPLAGVRFPAAALLFGGKVIIGVGGYVFWAEVAKLGQRRKVEVLVSQGFVGSNPTLRTSYERGRL